MRHARRVAFLAGSLAWLIPGHVALSRTASAQVDGLSIAAISCLWLACYGVEWGRAASRPLRAALALWFLAAALAAGAGVLRQPQGLVARYYNNSGFAGLPQRSWAAPCDACTRVDPQIAFGSRGHAFVEQYFPLFFANDGGSTRAWLAGARVIGEACGFSAEWASFLTVPARVRVRLLATGGTATFTLSGAVGAAGEVLVPPGVHALQVQYARTGQEPPSLRLQWDAGGGFRDVPPDAFGQRGATAGRLPGALAAVSVGAWLAGVVLVCAGARPVRLRVGPAACWGLFQVLFVQTLFETASAGAAFGSQIFAPGNDYLVYESFARDILSGDLLTRIESPVVVMNFGYRYFLAAQHLLVGEAPAEAAMLQQLVMALVVAMACGRIIRLFGAVPAVVTGLVAVGCHQLVRFQPPLLDTPWSVAFSTLALFALIDYGRRPGAGAAVLTGLALGITGLLRPNLLLLLGAAALWIPMMRGTGRRTDAWRHLALMVIPVVAVLSLLPWRNHVVGGEWRWLPNNGRVNLWVGNHPPQFNGRTYYLPKWMPPDEEVLPRVLEFIRSEPGAFARRVWTKSLYVLGVDVRAGAHVVPGVALPWTMAILGSILLWCRRSVTRRPELVLLWAWIALVSIPLVIVFPWSYGWRLSAPSYLPLYLLCGLACSMLPSHSPHLK
jgi:hypothetical protein